MKTDVPLLLRFGGIGLVFLGTVMVLVLGMASLQSRDAQEWPTVDARVIRSEIDVSKKMVPLGRVRRTHIDFFALRIEYEYEVDGERFTGKRMSLSSNPCGYDRCEIERWTRKYPLGATIPVYYCPAQPERSVVEPTGGPGPLGLVFGILAIPGGMVMRHIGKRTQPAGQTPARRTVRQPASTRPVQRQPVRQPVPTTVTDGPRVLRRTHWSIRTVGVLLGLALLLIGAVSLPVGVAQYSQAGNAVGVGDASPAARLVATVIVGLLVLFGALLIWMGMKRASQPVTFGSASFDAPPIPPRA